jgi:hypothetical protein
MSHCPILASPGPIRPVRLFQPLTVSILRRDLFAPTAYRNFKEPAQRQRAIKASKVVCSGRAGKVRVRIQQVKRRAALPLPAKAGQSPRR